MSTESQMGDTFQDFIRKWGAPDILLSDNAKAETSQHVKRILCEYNVTAKYTEPYHPNQSLADQRIQDVKNMSNIIIDRTNTPIFLWFLSLQYVVYLLNHLAVKSFHWWTPIEVSTGNTPDISNLLQFHWYQPVLYLDPSSSYPTSKEKPG